MLSIVFMKVQELEKEILDSKQKIEFYRVKMQELVSNVIHSSLSG